MIRRIPHRVLLLLTVLVALPGALAGHYGDPDGVCGAPGTEVLATLPPGGESTSYAVYVTLDTVAGEDYLWSTHWYAESNGVDGLQRFDDYCRTAGVAHDDADVMIG